MGHRGSLYIISAPSGAGKTSLVQSVADSTPHIVISISHTTRPQRKNEINGVNYYFVTPKQFQDELNQNSFLESAIVFENHYGTSENWVRQQLQQGKDVILEIDWQGARQIKKIMPDSISIFILPPSLAALKTRLINRNTDNQLTIDTRMEQAVNEIHHYDEFDYLVINDQFNVAVQDIQSIIRSRRLHCDWMQDYKSDLLDSLLS